MRAQTTSSRTKRSSSSTGSRSAQPPKTEDGEPIFDLLIADHRQVAAVFDELKAQLEEDEPDTSECLRLLTTIDALLTPHARAEERLIYPAFADATEEARDPVAEGFEEHALVHLLMGQLKEMAEIDEVWCAKAKVMMELVEHHVRDEEGEQFEAAREGLTQEEALDLGAQFVAGKLEIAEELGLPAPETLDLPAPKRTKPAKA